MFITASGTWALAAETAPEPGPADANDTLAAEDGDPRNDQETVKPLTLEEAMRLSVERGFSSRLASASAAAAEQRKVQARGQALPRIDLDAQRIWFSKDTNALTGVSPFVPARVTTAGVTVAQPIIGLAPLLLQIRAASLQADVASHEADTAKRDARLNGADAFIRARKALALHDVARKSRQVVERQQREARAAERAGRLARADVMRFELALADADAQLTQARITEEIALTALSETLGTPDDRYRVDNPDLSHFESARLKAMPLKEALARARDNRAEPKNAAANIEIAKYYKLAADLDYLPSLNAFARYERDLESRDTVYPPPPAPGGQPYARKDVQDKFSYGLQLKWNIWDWGTRWGRSGEYEANVEKALIARDASESQIRLEVTQAVLGVTGTVEGLETARSAVRLAEEVYRLTQARFQSGQATSSDVIAAERDQTRARGGLVNVRGDLDLAWLKFKRALGDDPEFR